MKPSIRILKEYRRLVKEVLGSKFFRAIVSDPQYLIVQNSKLKDSRENNDRRRKKEMT